MAVNYAELQNSPIEAQSVDGFVARRELLCAWSDRHALVAELDLSAYPHHSAARCVKTEVQPWPGSRVDSDGGDSQVAGYSHAKVTAHYRLQETVELAGSSSGYGSPGSTIYKRERVQTSLEMVRFHATHRRIRIGIGAAARWVHPGNLPAFPAFGFTYSVEYRRVPVLPTGLVGYIGTVNQSTVTSGELGMQFPPETLLFQTPSFERDVTTDGVLAWRLTYRMSYRKFGTDGGEAIGWNHFFFDGSWQRLRDAGDNVIRPHALSNWVDLLV